jgi:hypothetical protein
MNFIDINLQRHFYMKKVFSLLFFTVTVMTCFAQTISDSSKHLTFKGVPINGTLDEFVLQMKKNGFTNTGTKKGVAILEGDFASYKSCIVGVSTLKTKDLVSKITVLFPDRDTWSTLSSNYVNLKEMLTEKYGKPSDIVEKFDVPSYSPPKDDESKMYKVKFDNCKYHSIWQTDKGEIQLSIDHDGVTRCFVKLAYFDKINSEVVKKQAIDDL